VNVARCIGCGCDDDHACDLGCSWLVVDRRASLGVCSECHARWTEFLKIKRAGYFVPILYKIATAGGARYVNGYTVRLPAPFTGLRFCVREERGEWCVDHYDSGKGVIGPVVTVEDG
jgi:hypothetical protein